MDIPESGFLHRGPENDSLVQVMATGPRGHDVVAPDGRTFRVSRSSLRPLPGIPETPEVSPRSEPAGAIRIKDRIAANLKATLPILQFQFVHE